MGGKTDIIAIAWIESRSCRLDQTTSYIFTFPVLAWLVVSVFKARGLRALKCLGVIVAVVFIINAGHYARNFDLFGNPLGPSEITTLFTNKTHSAQALASNLIKNISLHMSTPFYLVNRGMEALIVRAHDNILGIGVMDPRLTWGKGEFHILSINNNEDFSGNPIHFVIIATAIAVCS